MGNIWLVPHPVAQFREDVKALAREHGLQIVDAKFAEIYSADDLARDPPELTPVTQQKRKRKGA